MIGQIVSHYRIMGQLGEGGMGVVYVAEDTRLGRRVALKIPTAGAAGDNHHHARFLREARSISALNHPHIATVFDFGEMEDGRPFIVMELVNGPDLGELLRAGELTLGRAVEIVEEVAGALAEAHRHGIIHRDIKPSNVLINERGEVKVVDFGLAKLTEEGRAVASAATDHEAATLFGIRTRSDVILGTPLYLSPEQVKGQSVDGRSDLFALGALLYECLAGRPAFAGQTVLEIAAQVLHVHPPPPSQFNPRVPAALDRITLKAIHKQPDARYQSAEELSADLRAARQSLSGSEHVRTLRQFVSATAPGAFRSSALITLSDQLRRPRISLGAVLLIFAALLAGAWGISRLLRPAPYQPAEPAQRLYEKGVDFLREGAYHQASAALERAVQADDEFALAHARLAEAWTELAYTDKAKDEMLRVSALRADGRSFEPLDALYLDAVSATVTRDFPRAIKAYQEIAQRAPERAHVYVDLGRAYEKAEDSQNAIASYREATNRDPQDATAYLRLGVLYGRKGDLPSATAAFDKAEAIYRDLGNQEGRTEVLNQRGVLLSNLGQIPAARAQLEQARELARTTGNQAQQIRALLQLSTVAFNESNYEQGLAHARAAIESAQANGMENLMARGYAELGGVYLAARNYAEAEKHLLQALDIAQRYKVRRTAAQAMLNLGSIRIQQSRADEAVRYIEEALPFYREGNYRKELRQGLLLLGRANKLKGNYAAALQTAEQELQLAQQIGDQSLVALAHSEIGSALRLQERYAEALKHYEQKYQISKSLGEKRDTPQDLLSLSSVLWPVGRYEEARAALKQALGLAEGGKDRARLAEIYRANAEMELSERLFAEAKKNSRQALEVDDTPDLDLVARAKSALCIAQVYTGAGRAGSATCEEAMRAATQTNDPNIISHAQLALAEALLEDGDADGALANAKQALEFSMRAGQMESAWRASMFAARAYQRQGDLASARESAARAAELRESLQQKWGAEDYRRYLTRADVQFYLNRLGEELAGNK
ncbi:MAG: tetratricopeptide repeat protein [Acidobacteria bacterium]|nr:tetratricopeptide repeat protein [Acidobacteriota bacterium]